MDIFFPARLWNIRVKSDVYEQIATQQQQQKEKKNNKEKKNKKKNKKKKKDTGSSLYQGGFNISIGTPEIKKIP